MAGPDPGEWEDYMRGLRQRVHDWLTLGSGV